MPHMHPVQALSWTHPLQEREPVSGFASRLAALNGVDLATLLREMGIPYLGVYGGAEGAVRDVAALAGLDDAGTARLLHYTPRHISNNRSSILAGEHFDSSSVHRGFFRYCPHCIKEDLERVDGPVVARPWLRVDWLINPIRTCRQHNVMLQAAYRDRPEVQGLDFAEMIFQQILPSLDAFIEQAVVSPHSDFERWVIERVDGIRQRSNWLDQMPLRIGIAFCEGLGVSALHPSLVKVKTFSALDWANAASEGYRLASRGENGISECLNRLVEAQKETRGEIGLRDTYGYVYGLLQRKQGDLDFEMARSVVRRHAIDTLPLEPGTDVLGVVLHQRQLHSVRSISIAAGLHSSTTRKWLARKGLIDLEQTVALTDHRITIPADSIELMVAKLSTSLTLPSVVERTGIPREHLRSMISHGFLPTLTDSHNWPGAKHRFAVDDVDALMEKMFAGAEPMLAATGRRMTLPKARKVAMTSLDNLIAWLMEGKLTWKGRIGDEIHYGNLLVDADELKALVRTEPDEIGLKRHELQDFMPGLGKPTVGVLIKLGELKTTGEFNPGARRLVNTVTQESADTFKDQYVTLAQLCLPGKRSPKSVRKQLNLAGVYEAFRFEEVRTAIYPREAAWDAMRRLSLLQPSGRKTRSRAVS